MGKVPAIANRWGVYFEGRSLGTTGGTAFTDRLGDSSSLSRTRNDRGKLPPNASANESCSREWVDCPSRASEIGLGKRNKDAKSQSNRRTPFRVRSNGTTSDTRVRRGSRAKCSE